MSNELIKKSIELLKTKKNWDQVCDVADPIQEWGTPKSELDKHPALKRAFDKIDALGKKDYKTPINKYREADKGFQAFKDRKKIKEDIHINPAHKGLLHKDLGKSPDKKLTKSDISKAKHSSDPAERKRANFAYLAKYVWHHKEEVNKDDESPFKGGDTPKDQQGKGTNMHTRAKKLARKKMKELLSKKKAVKEEVLLEKGLIKKIIDKVKSYRRKKSNNKTLMKTVKSSREKKPAPKKTVTQQKKKSVTMTTHGPMKPLKFISPQKKPKTKTKSVERPVTRKEMIKASAKHRVSKEIARRQAKAKQTRDLRKTFGVAPGRVKKIKEEFYALLDRNIEDENKF